MFCLSIELPYLCHQKLGNNKQGVKMSCSKDFSQNAIRLPIFNKQK